jgi:hypothetical protein
MASGTANAQATTKLRAWWAHRQGLDGSLDGATAAQVLERTGWARSVGGVGPYLTLFSRAALSREAVDRAVADVEIHELPAARGCTYVVPARDFGLALQCAPGEDAEMALARKFGVADREIDRLCDAVVDAVSSLALLPDELRAAVGGAVRSLGPDAAKKGLTSTLPLALGRLQSAGEIRRIPANGRLDQQRYRYARWHPNPCGRQMIPPGQVHVELARRYFRWIAPATVGEFQWFSGLGAKAARAVVGALGLVPITDADGRMMFPDDLDAFRAFTPPRAAHYVLVSSLDGISHLRRDVRGLADDEDLARAVPGGKAGAALGGLADLPSHAIVDRGRLVGLWEFDPDAQAIAWWPFAAAGAALKDAVARTERFVRDELGDARSFSLDTPKSRAPRIEAIRTLKAPPGTRSR